MSVKIPAHLFFLYHIILQLSSTGGGKWAASIACSACLPSPVLHLYCIEELACSLFPASLGSSIYFVALPVGSPKIIVLGINWTQAIEANTLHSLKDLNKQIDQKLIGFIQLTRRRVMVTRRSIWEDKAVVESIVLNAVGAIAIKTRRSLPSGHRATFKPSRVR